MPIRGKQKSNQRETIIFLNKWSELKTILPLWHYYTLSNAQKDVIKLLSIWKIFRMCYKGFRRPITLIKMEQILYKIFFSDFVWQNVFGNKSNLRIFVFKPFLYGLGFVRATALGEPPQQRTWCHAQARLITFSNRNIFHFLKKINEKVLPNFVWSRSGKTVSNVTNSD